MRTPPEPGHPDTSGFAGYSCLVTALPAEARVFIERYQLQKVAGSALNWYQGDRCHLLQTGIGKSRSTAAVAALLQECKHIDAIINVGIAGGPFPLGEVCLASAVVDADNEQCWYPGLPPKRCFPASTPHPRVRTLERPSDDYTQNVLYDMEAAGIVNAATGYLDLDRIQSIKAVSDNAVADFTTVARNQVQSLMTATLPWVDSMLGWYASMQQTDRGKAGAMTRSEPPALLNHRRDVANTIACPAGWHPYYQSLLARFHHSATRRHQLDRLLQRLATRGVTLDQPGELTDRLPDTTSAHELHRQLQALIDATKLTYPEFSGQIVAHTAP